MGNWIEIGSLIFIKRLRVFKSRTRYCYQFDINSWMEYRYRYLFPLYQYDYINVGISIGITILVEPYAIWLSIIVVNMGVFQESSKGRAGTSFEMSFSIINVLKIMWIKSLKILSHFTSFTLTFYLPINSNHYKNQKSWHMCTISRPKCPQLLQS